MINFRFSLENHQWNRFANIWSKAGPTPFANKFWEIQIMKSNDIIAVDLRITRKTDHAGIDLWTGLFGYAVNLQLYDNRHWDYENNTWYTHTD